MLITLFKKGIILFIAVAVLFFPNMSSAQTTPVNIPFGGRLITPIVCTCSGGVVMVVYDFVTKVPTLPILYQPGYSRINQWYNFYTPSVMMLGTYHVGGICLVSVTGGDCEPSPVQPIGTVTPYPTAGFGTGAGPSITD